MRKDFDRVLAEQLQAGDRLCFDEPRFDVVIERISFPPDGWIGLHANDDSWHAWRRPGDTVWRGHGEAVARPDVIEERYVVSVMAERITESDREEGGSGTLETLRDHEPVDHDGLAKMIRHHGIDTAQDASDPLCFVSSYHDEDRAYFEQGVESYYTLQIHSVDGRAATPADTPAICRAFGIKPPPNVAASADTKPRGPGP